MSVEKAKGLRGRMTEAERRLWYRLRAHRFAGVKFKRQVPIGRYVVDSVCFDHSLSIEVDGGQHATSLNDRSRTQWLEGEGFRVLRFWNNDVLGNLPGVLETVASALSRSPSLVALRAPPSPTRGEGKESS
jgi:very-short-patch-repair endonuclease